MFFFKNMIVVKRLFHHYNHCQYCKESVGGAGRASPLAGTTGQQMFARAAFLQVYLSVWQLYSRSRFRER